jgi:hypothetical protein
VLETLRFTDAPRRLKPVALHYHAYIASSPAGLDSLRHIYAWLATQELLPVRVADYAARVQAFRELALARDLSGAFSLHGGAALRTLRLPSELGEPDLAASSGVAAFRALPQGRYVSFTGSGPRKLVLAAAVSDGPRLVSANGSVEKIEVVAPGQLALEVSGLVPVQLELAGLPPNARCTWRSPARSLTLASDAAGSLLVRLGERATGPAELRCALEN